MNTKIIKWSTYNILNEPGYSILRGKHITIFNTVDHYKMYKKKSFLNLSYMWAKKKILSDIKL